MGELETTQERRNCDNHKADGPNYVSSTKNKLLDCVKFGARFFKDFILICECGTSNKKNYPYQQYLNDVYVFECHCNLLLFFDSSQIENFGTRPKVLYLLVRTNRRISNVHDFKT